MKPGKINFIREIVFQTLQTKIMRKRILFSLAVLIALCFINPSSFATVINPSTSVIVPGNPDPAKVKSALSEFKSLSKKEKRERFKEIKAEIRHYKAEKKAGHEPSTNTLLLVILAIILPPLAVYLFEDEINNKFWISLILTLLFWIPGVIYALVVILSGDK